MVIRFFLIAIIFFFIEAVSAQKKPSKIIMDSTKEEGILVGTISLENRKQIAQYHTFFFLNDSIQQIFNNNSIKESIAHKAKWNNKIRAKKKDGFFKEGKKWVYLFYIVKPAGEYKFYEIQVFLNSGYMQSTWTMPIDIPFEIEVGKVRYFGELNLNVKGGRLRIINNYERDKAKFKEKYPELEL